jgi:pimeloyl-ACP methyl ester carboxylesterase
MNDLVLHSLTELLPCQVRRGELRRGGRTLRWIEAGDGGPVTVLEAAMGEPGSLGYAGVLPAIAARTRVIAYDRAGLGVSDPVSDLTLDIQVEDLAAILAQANDGHPCVVAGHSWGGLLVLLAAARHPELIAGLVLIDPSDEIYWAGLPPAIHQENDERAAMFLAQHASGELPQTIRNDVRSYVERLSDSDRLRSLMFEAYVSCFARPSQVAMIQDESDLFINSVAAIRQIRQSAPLPDVPVVVLSATTGTAPEIRQKWTGVHADLVASVPRGTHIVLQDTGHAINEERPDAIVDAVIRVLDQVAPAPSSSPAAGPAAGPAPIQCSDCPCGAE